MRLLYTMIMYYQIWLYNFSNLNFVSRNLQQKGGAYTDNIKLVIMQHVTHERIYVLHTPYKSIDVNGRAGRYFNQAAKALFPTIPSSLHVHTSNFTPLLFTL